ncbi:glycosyltransferase [Xenorhabdus sp. Sc-CR9]|uniref:glycosyltransferase n=1 Tax=Xenorhabdus sp. Sc-CR9 TaxID=2584468 RepID=UPI001F3521C0|nr:glycosyltransferase [Xenorhabdus sp. Sc-CR9]
MKHQLSDNEKMTIAIVINEKYISNHYADGFKVGATSFTIKIADFFIDKQLFAGFILYKRDESLLVPKINQLEKNGIKYVKLFFNFSMNPEDIKDALDQCLSLLAQGDMQKKSNIFSYYQTDTLIPYHPENIPCGVTHHGPFVEDFQNNYSQDESYLAFENKEKAVHLYKQQALGINTLVNQDCFIIQHSTLQGNYLLSKGVRREKIKQISPPMFSSKNKKFSILHQDINEFIKIKKEEILLFTAVARLDYFKNIELLINASLSLLEKSIPVKILILGDDKKYSSRRNALYSMIPIEYRKCFLILHKLPQSDLLGIFNAIKKKAIFVCSSRYETLGITPLEAALNGIYSIVPNLDVVEASTYFSSKDKFEYDIASLVEKIISVYVKKSFTSNTQQQLLNTLLSQSIFEQSMNKIYDEISMHYLIKIPDHAKHPL